MLRTGYVYDERMCKHENEAEDHPECPDRIKGIMREIRLNSLDKLMVHVPSREATIQELSKTHKDSYINNLIEIMKLDQTKLFSEEKKFNSIYFNKHSLDAAKLAAGSIIDLVDKVVSDELSNGVAIIRPPGHHAEHNCAMGFCLFNNVAVVANVMMEKYTGLNRIAIIDWDVHHGNATQHMFYDDDRVLYISLHRHDNGKFYPGGNDGSPSMVGTGKGKGKNINIAWSTNTPENIGDKEYIYAFHKIIIPVLKEYDPQLILVSAGFDCALGDPLGNLSVTPVGFEHMTAILKDLQSNGKIVIALEGGYNISAISRSMTACTRILLGAKPVPIYIDANKINKDCTRSINETIKEITPYWKCFDQSYCIPLDKLTV